MTGHQWWIDFRARIAALFGRRTLLDRADEELQFHLAMLEQRLIDSGRSPAEARALARRRFGNVAHLRERTLDSWRYAFMDTFIQNLRYGVRTLRRNRGFAAAAILILGLAIGASTAIFSVFDARPPSAAVPRPRTARADQGELSRVRRDRSAARRGGGERHPRHDEGVLAHRRDDCR
jgi:hypothetical protein